MVFDLPRYGVLCLALLIGALFIYLHRWTRAHGSGTGGTLPPPSPWVLPVIGHIHHLAGALPHHAMRDLAAQLGPLMLLRLGELRVVVASSADAAREIMKTNDLAFATRSVTRMGRILIGDGADGLVFAPYGDGWRQLRRICATELFSARRVRSFRPVREEEVRRLLRSVLASPAPAVLDVLLRVQRDDALDPPLTTDNIKTVILDIFAASSETSSTTLQWTMAELMRNTRVMRKAQDEVRRVLAGQDAVTEDSLSGLRYLPLVIKEALRLHPPAPLLVPRECRSPCRVLGFDVPVGAMVLVNAWAIGRDPSYWDAPEEFMPERFESSDIDFKGMDFEFIPFGAGRRMCPGIGFNMDLALASLLYHFDWELPDEKEPGELDMTEALGFTTRRLAHLVLVPTVRVPLRGE